MSATALLFTSFICASQGSPNQMSLSTNSQGEIRETRAVRDGQRLTVDTRTIAKNWNVSYDGDNYVIHNEIGSKVLTLNKDEGARTATATYGRGTLRCFLDRKFFAHSTTGDFCEAGTAPQNLSQQLADPKNRLAFPNGPYGLMDGGVCWWINKFERNALYLAKFNPNAKAPTKSDGKKIIEKIREAKGIVEVPGFANLRDFTAAFKTELIDELEEWQLWDGVMGGGWINGVSGSTSVDPQELLKTMEQTYKIVEGNKLPAYHMLQLPGVTAHSWMVIGMVPHLNPDGQQDGFDFMVADSNYNELAMWHEYRHGMRQLTFYEGVPYLKNAVNKETALALEKRKAYCSQQATSLH